jgi:hypothetical protein
MAYETDVSRGSGRSFSKKASGLNTLMGTSKGADASHVKFYELEAAEVLDIILDDTHPDYKTGLDIGKIKARMVNSEFNVKKEILTWIIPLESNIKDYPIKGEYVIVSRYLGKTFYSQKLNFNNNINNNIYPGLSIDEITTKGASSTADNYQATSATGGTIGLDEIELTDVYNTFSPTIGIFPIKIKEGDVVFNGRFGQSIKFSYGKDNEEAYTSPNILIRAGQRLSTINKTWLSEQDRNNPIEESINEDGTNIHLTTDEEVILTPAPANSEEESDILYQRFVEAPETFDGKQIILNSDRLIFNTREKEFMCFSKLSQYFCTTDRFIVDTSAGIILNSLADIVINNTTDDANTKTIINSPEIFLGVTDEENPALEEGTLEHLVLGETLKMLLEELIGILEKCTYINGAGPASMNPANTVELEIFKMKLGNFLSKQNFTL